MSRLPLLSDTQESQGKRPREERDVEEREAKRLRKEAKKARKEAKKLKKEERDRRRANDSSGPDATNGTRSTNGDKTTANPPSATSAASQQTEPARASSPEGRSKSAIHHYTQDARITGLAKSDVEAYLSNKDIQVVDPRQQSELCRPISAFDYLPAQGKAYSNIFKTFSEPTPIQAAAWPFLFAHRDVIGVAETGSGKTLAFGIPCVERIRALPAKERRHIKAVIVSPTRELACQIFDQLEKLAQPAGLNVVCIYGGVPKDQQRADLKRSQIVVATPGRLFDLMSEQAADISHADYVCLDEADRMLDKGFEEDIKKIISATAPTSSRQTVMFTATWPQSIRDLANTFMKTPVQIYIGNTPTGELKANVRIEQSVEVMDPRDKEMRLHKLLQQYQKGSKSRDRILVFCLYKKEAARIENFIHNKGFNVVGIHGDLAQAKRTASLQAFKSGNVTIMVATDVAARGLDIPAVKLVINVTFPLTAEDYVHRIGRYEPKISLLPLISLLMIYRTGRAGETGKSITFFTEHEKSLSGA
jgi:ATP-dependent RNA helicase DBP3